MGERADDDADSFDAFFRRSSRQLVVLAYMLTADQAAAQDLAQEALLRAWARWPLVAKLDDPVGWTRRVLHNLVVSKGRYEKVRRREIARPIHSPPPDSDHLELAAMLRSIPRDQAIALVLHDGAGTSVRAIADQMGVPEGTVKSWLSRGRSAAAAGLTAAPTPSKEDHVCR